MQDCNPGRAYHHVPELIEIFCLLIPYPVYCFCRLHEALLQLRHCVRCLVKARQCLFQATFVPLHGPHRELLHQHLEHCRKKGMTPSSNAYLNERVL